MSGHFSLPDRHRRYSDAVRGEPLPVALIDLDAVDHNIDVLLRPLAAGKKTLRIASKSLRCVELLRYIASKGGAQVRGVMAFSPAEAHYLAEQGLDDILVAYPTAQVHDARLVAEANRKGAYVSLAVDSAEHLAVAAHAAADEGARIPIIVDIDVAYRPLGDRLHIGVRRSPLRAAAEVISLVEQIRSFPDLVFGGLLAYEAHIAGVLDENPFAPGLDRPKRAMKRLAAARVRALREEVVRKLGLRDIAVPLFNGGGTGSIESSCGDSALTEVTAGSGFVDSHLFDGYRGLDLEPAIFFALQVTRRPGPGFVTCQSGGFIASGAAGLDRLPIPYLPEGLRLTGLEGAGEVQTPLIVPAGQHLELGAPVFFRHAKAGELAEHFLTYLFVRGDRIVSRASTYRGAGRAFF